ncbi:hypothetical protein TWF718_004628 [Orbilia javanica]|uniref:Uncharacterized protein n=1 Tax=Orbilia javanica TaxID=47235 RepID=A0AAN8MSH7_9PEZI
MPRFESHDGGSDHRPLRGILKKPEIPLRTSSLHALHRSRSSENLRPQITVEETTSRRRGSSVSLPPGAPRSPSIPLAVPEVQKSVLGLQPTVAQERPADFSTSKLILPLSTPYVAPQTSLQPAIATPVLVIPESENPYDLAISVDDNRSRRVSTGSIDPFAKEEGDQVSAKEGAKNLLGTGMDSYNRFEHLHVGWKTDFLTPTPEEGIEGVSETYRRRRSSSLPDLPGAGGGRPLKSVKGRRATPWVHNIGINGSTAGNGKGKRVKLAFPSLKRLSDASVKSIESGHEVWFDALEEQEN